MDQLVGVIIGKADSEGGSSSGGGENHLLRGYIAMLAVETSFRRAGIGKPTEKHVHIDIKAHSGSR